jgi:succinate dehydrogenase / fumarate reductase cytochrome b subunit
MRSAFNFYESTVGKKVIMAVTGLIGVGFVIGHMAGNLQAFVGRGRMNAYGALLHGPLAELLWLVRLVLIAAVVLHVVMALQLTRRAKAARPTDYRVRVPQVATLASRTMRWGGMFLVVFIVVHILHFTTGTIRPSGSFIVGDVYGNLVSNFRIWWVSVFYVAAMVVLGMHLYHGAWSSIRTVGYAKPSANPLQRTIALLVAAVVWLGFTLVPVGVMAGVIR